jgi:predicted MPP superfamily phosphohydrolase
MAVFLFLYFTVFGAMHAILVWRIRAAFPSPRWLTPALVALSAAMILLPIISRLFMRFGMERLGTTLYVGAFSWLIWLFWFLMATFAIVLWNLLCQLVPLIFDNADWPTRLLVGPRFSLLICVALILAGTVYGFHEAKQLRVETVHVACQRLPANLPPLRIVQMTDLHLGAVMPLERVEEVAQKVRELKPDLIVATGDMVDAPTAALREEAKLLSELEAPLGKWAVTGNHEFYANLADALEFHRQTGFRMLRGETIMLPNGFRLSGVDDPAGRMRGVDVKGQEEEALGNEKSPPFTILLKHQPRVRKESLGRFDLQLSGHIHGGQVFPFGLFVRLFYRHGVGLHELGEGSFLYVSRGTGTWGAPMRVLAPPELTLLVLEPALE